MAHPARPPTLRVTPLPEHHFLSSLIEMPGMDVSLLVLRDGARCYIGRAPSDEERNQLLDASNETTVLLLAQRLQRTAAPVAVHADLTPFLAALIGHGAGWVLRSPTDPMPWSIGELVEEGRAAEAQLCRDDDCDGQHAWISHARMGDGRSVWFCWHLNLRSGLVVPPLPLQVR